jgi:hypothetical protein
MISPVARGLPAQDDKNTKETQISMSRVGFEPTIPVFEREKSISNLRPRGHCDRSELFINYLKSWKIL